MIPRKDDDPGTPGKGKPFSVSFSTAPKRATNLPQNSRPQGSSSSLRRRPRHLTHDDESEEEDADPIHEEVTGFDTSAGGAISKNAVSKHKQPLVIHVESKNNWRDRPGTNRRGKNLLPQEVQAARKEAVVETETPSISYGLSLAPSKDVAPDDAIHEKEPDVAMLDAVSSSQPREPLTQDEIALQALIRESERGDKERRSDLVIESVQPEVRYDETSSFRADVATRPEQASLDAYEAVPVEEFGAALLRGMGWKEGQAIGRGNYGNTSAANQVRVPQRRPGFLGIGAKDISGEKGAEVEIGAWGKAAMRKGSRKGGDGSGSTAGVYMPVVMKNKTTGEHLTEEEFKIRQKEAGEGKAKERIDDERPSHRSITNGRDRERAHRSHRYDDESDTDRDRSRKHRRSYSSRRERSRSSGAHDRRSYRYDDDDRERSSRDPRRYRDRDDGDHRRPVSRDRSHRAQTHSRLDNDYHRTRDRHHDSGSVRSDRNRDRRRA